MSAAAPRVARTAAELGEAHSGRPVFLIPTMGALHPGHIALAERARERADAAGGAVCASIFVNPLQFGPQEDFDVYPRDLDGDLAKLAGLADTCFVPAAGEVYPEPQRIEIHAPELGALLCGATRPHFFAGVLTVVAKLFALVRPAAAFFGRKDYQQLVLVRMLARQLHMPVEVVGVETVRESDGLACSSRNLLLSEEHRAIAPGLRSALADACDSIGSGGEAGDVCAKAARRLSEEGFRVDYVECRGVDLSEWDAAADGEFIVFGAAHLGEVRLIDNVHGRAEARR